MIIRDLEGNEFTLEVNSSTNIELNGNKSLSFIIHPSDNNKLFIEDVDKLWEVIDADDVVYKIIYLNPRGKGDSLTVQVKAVPKSFDDLNADRVYERIDEHMTAFQCFSRVFDGTDYRFVLLDSFPAVQWEGFADGDTRLEMFKNALNRYEAEFELLGNEFRIRHMIGRDTQFMYHYKLNASNISKEEDASNYWTYIKGFGDYGLGSSEDGTNDEEPKLEMEYMSPLAELVGVRHAPPLKDGRITDENTMMSKLKETVDNSVQLNVSTTLHDLRDQGYPLARPQVGDRVFLVDDRIKVNYEMRVVSITEIRDVKDRLIKVSIDLGTDPMAKRRQSNRNNILDQLHELIRGKLKLPMSVLDETILRVSKALLDAQTELDFTDNGIIAVAKDDPNKLVILNSEGLGVSVDGGATFRQAITSEGINGDVITTGIVRGPNMYMSLIDGMTVFTNPFTGDTLYLDQGEIRFQRGAQGRHLRYNAEGLILIPYESNTGTSQNTALILRGRGGALGSHQYLDFEGNEDAPNTARARIEHIGEEFLIRHPDDSSVDVYDRSRNLDRGTLTAAWLKTRHSSGQILEIRRNRIQTLRDGNRDILISPNGTGIVKIANEDEEYYNIRASTFLNSSSRELKDHIKSCTKSGLDMINQLEVVEFDWIKDIKEGVENRQIGFIAEDSPIISDAEGKSIDSPKLTTINTKAIQELNEIVNTQKEEINDLKKLVNQLMKDKE